MREGGVLMVENMVNIIQSLGFPIACCIALFWKMNKQDENQKQMTDAINNNTNVITRLIDKLDKGD